MKKKLDIAPYNDKDRPHGYWEVYWHDGTLMGKGHQLNGKQIGYWEVSNFGDIIHGKKYYIR